MDVVCAKKILQASILRFKTLFIQLKGLLHKWKKMLNMGEIRSDKDKKEDLVGSESPYL